MLTALHDELLAHVGGRLHDDAALLLLRKRPTDEPVPAVPAQHRLQGPPPRTVAGVDQGRG